MHPPQHPRCLPSPQELAAAHGSCSVVMGFGSPVFSLLQECPFPWKSVQHPHATAISADQPCDIGHSTAPECWGCSRCEAAAEQQCASKEEQAASTEHSQVRIPLLPFPSPRKATSLFVEVVLTSSDHRGIEGVALLCYSCI